MKNSFKNIEDRQKELLEIIVSEQKISTEELMKRMHVSISTVRRDLNILENKKLIRRKYGVAEINQHYSTNFDEFGPEQIKKTIANRAAKFINNYDTVFVNTSSTALMVLNYLTSNHNTIITNNLKIANVKHNPTTNYILSGGEMRFPKEALVGDIALDTITKMTADVCIIGSSGVDTINGVTTTIFNEAKINAEMIRRTKKTRILVADYRKLSNVANFKVADLSLFDYLITDAYSTSEVIQKIENLGLQVIQVPI